MWPKRLALEPGELPRKASGAVCPSPADRLCLLSWVVTYGQLCSRHLFTNDSRQTVLTTSLGYLSSASAYMPMVSLAT